MNKINIIIYPYKGNVALLKANVLKWQKQYTEVDISLRSNTQRKLPEHSHFLALYTTRANKKINIETNDEEKVLTYKDSSYMKAYRTFLLHELGREIPNEDFICIDDKNVNRIEKRIQEIVKESKR